MVMADKARPLLTKDLLDFNLTFFLFIIFLYLNFKIRNKLVVKKTNKNRMN